jgi:hypothetical protein
MSNDSRCEWGQHLFFRLTAALWGKETKHGCDLSRCDGDGARGRSGGCIGAGVTGFEAGQRVAALTVYGACAEYLTREAEHFVPIPDGISDRDAAAVILNYITAWQMIHRVANVRRGQTALVTRAAGVWAPRRCNYSDCME